MRWPDLDDTEQRDPELVARFAERVGPALERYFQPVIQGLDRIPTGAALYVGNHNACMLTPDTFVFAIAVYRQRGLVDLPYGLAHEVALGFPGLRQLLTGLGGVRASHQNAAKLFAKGRKALVYPGGDLDAMRPYRDRNRIIFGPRRGYMRLALRHGVPIIPLVSAGAHETLLILSDNRWLARLIRSDKWLRCKTWPLSLSLPWGLTLGPVPPHLPLPTRIYIETLDPLQFERSGERAASDDDYVEACHERLMGAMQTALDRLAAQRLAEGGKRLL